MKAMRTLLLAFMITFLILPGQARAALYDDIRASLICPECLDDRMTVAACNDSTADQTRQEIQQKLAAGQTKEQIIDYYVGIYGEEILAVPTKKGFNLTAWVIPPLAALAGIVLVYFALSGWVRNHGGRKQALHTSGTYVDPVDEERLKEEIRKYL